MVIQGYPDPGEGLRLHLNENTGGCSAQVLDAIRRVRPRLNVPTLTKLFGIAVALGAVVRAWNVPVDVGGSWAAAALGAATAVRT